MYRVNTLFVTYATLVRSLPTVTYFIEFASISSFTRNVPSATITLNGSANDSSGASSSTGRSSSVTTPSGGVNSFTQEGVR